MFDACRNKGMIAVFIGCRIQNPKEQSLNTMRKQ
jgi:hypothetical protein